MAKDKDQTKVQEGEVAYYLTLKEITVSLGVSSEVIIEILEEGIVTEQPEQPDQWIFDDEAMHRIKTALQLNRDLGINWAGAALALDLLDEIARLHRLLPDVFKTGSNHE